MTEPPLSEAWTLSEPDDNNHVWMHVDFGGAKSSINLGERDKVHEKLAEWCASWDRE